VADVVLDEWVLIRGLEAEQPSDGFERDSADLLALVQASHRWVMTDEVVDAYQRRLYGARYKADIWTRLRASFLGTLVNSNRPWLKDVPVIDGAYDRDDTDWVSAAAAAPAGCLLVTGDRRLLVALAAPGLPALHTFVPCFVTDALAMLDPRQPVPR
jgi:predicted nucleic acid-binding protein